MHLIKKLTFITAITTTLFAFDGMSIGYDGSKFQSATFHKNQMIYGLDFLHANLSSENKVCGYVDYWGDCDYYNTEELSMSINIFMPRI